jgi:hypothetical protein
MFGTIPPSKTLMGLKGTDGRPAPSTAFAVFFANRLPAPAGFFRFFARLFE